MNLQHARTTTAENIAQGNTTNACLRGIWFMLARILWLAVVVLTLAFFVASIPAFYAFLQSGCASAACRSLLAPYTVQYIKASGLSINFFLIYFYMLFVVLLLVFLIMGALLFWLRSHERMALFTSFALVTFPIFFNSSLLLTLLPGWWLPMQLVGFLNGITLGNLFYLFPNGRFVPRWTRWLVVAVVVNSAASSFFPNTPFANFWLISNLFPILAVTGVVAQVYRYRIVSGLVERQQTKWVAAGLSISILGALLVIGIYYINAFALFHPNARTDLLAGAILYLFILLIPLSIAFAILRSRLWDIDIIINRTLVYGILTGILALLYASSILLLQFLLRGIIQQNNAIAIVVSTIGIYALFNPLRRRIQNIIDRRFYRRKYDAVRTLATFNATLRSEVDLSQLREQLLTVVEETMQPAHVSLWLNQDQRHNRSQAGRKEEKLE